MGVSKYGEAPIAPDHDLNRLAAFVEQRLDPAERASVVQHLAACVECREVVAGLAREGIGEARTGLRTVRAAVWLPIAASIVLVIGAGWFARDRLLTPDAPVPPPPTPTILVPIPEPGPKPEPPPPDPGTIRRSANEREIAGRRFKLEAGIWIDTAYDQFALLPVVDVKTAADRDALLAKLPALKPFIDLGPRVTVVYQGTVYRFDLPR